MSPNLQLLCDSAALDQPRSPASLRPGHARSSDQSPAPYCQSSTLSSLSSTLRQYRVCRRSLRTILELSLHPPAPEAVAALSQPPLPSFDDLYEYYDPDTEPQILPARQQATPQSQRRPPSSSSGSARSLRRTPRLEERNASRQRPSIPVRRKSPTNPSPSPPKPIRQPLERGRRSSDNLFGNSGSTTPRSFQRIVSQESFWPRRSTHISSRTHEAILFALEAIRIGSGKDPQQLTADRVEENARMSDLFSATQPTGSGGQNGSSRAARGPVPVGADPARVRTPTDIMKARQERDARKRAAEQQRQRELEEQARREAEEVATVPTQESPAQRRSGGRRSGGDSQVMPEMEQRISDTRRSENLPPPAAQAGSRSRTNTADQGARPISQQQSVSLQNPATATGAPGRSRNDPPPLNVSTQNPQISRQPSQQAEQSAGRSGFPHAFERWETLSSHWEGLTSYWVRRLQENSSEITNVPINQQMSRQITDLSAAGANLFHAVVELQRLRASSERKFQRWFFETRQEHERAQETQGELERTLRSEREERANALASIGTAQADRMKSDDLVREMRRELQISKEEARRAWEELGRREQEERERTISLRSGEPTLVGGVQVVPMTQGVPSRQTSTAQRPTTRDGPLPGGPGPGAMGGQQFPRSTTNTTLDSPGDEQRQFSYDPQATSPTSTDPFTEVAQPPREFASSQVTQPPSSAAAIAAARAAQLPPATQRPTTTTSAPSPSRGYAQSTAQAGGDPRFYQQQGTDTAILHPTTNGTSAPLYQTARPGTTSSQRTDERSFIPSTSGSDFGEDEYEINPDGSYRLDDQGRRIPYLSSAPSAPLAPSDDDEYDVADQVARERVYRAQYGSSTAAAPPPQQAQSAYAQVTTARPQDAAEYVGEGWGEPYQDISTHRHPTRLSDIVEERSGISSPSRASYISGGGEQSTRGGDLLGGASGYPSSRAPRSDR